ncbi:unnamed protein product [Clavelina lepadiformis]|uniref:C-type lectin domain-containing protein n=1 Tax=Clavelina lepadiformis TaxID=159417 RepID=A0ABP0GMI1_CLALP
MKVLCSFVIASFLIVLGNGQQCCNDLRREIRESMYSDWFFPLNGYKYKLTSRNNNWNSARYECYLMGADLAAVGIRDPEVEGILWDEFHDSFPWVGLTDQAREGRYVWVDGVAGTSSNIFWGPDEPNHGAGNEDCVNILWSDPGISDALCSDRLKGLCEKKV